MAKPINATPVLSGKEADDFLTALHDNSSKKVSLVPTPKLNKADELIKKHGKNR